MSTEPKRKNYFDYDLYREDSISWTNDPLYGWCNKNKKPDGNPYNLYTDGLQIYTTVNSHMQQYAEEAVKEHLGGYLQPAFFKEKKGSKRAPFSSDLTDKDIDKYHDPGHAEFRPGKEPEKPGNVYQPDLQGIQKAGSDESFQLAW